jgi:putative membrane protein
MAIADLPALHACLNAAAATLLAGGWIAIRRGWRRTHIFCAVTATALTLWFLGSYVFYHAMRGLLTTELQMEGLSKTLYWIILWTHIPLAMVLLPMIGHQFWLALKKRDFAAHRRLGRVVSGIWLYVAITGVMIFAALYVL